MSPRCSTCMCGSRLDPPPEPRLRRCAGLVRTAAGRVAKPARPRDSTPTDGAGQRCTRCSWWRQVWLRPPAVTAHQSSNGVPRSAVLLSLVSVMSKSSRRGGSSTRATLRRGVLLRLSVLKQVRWAKLRVIRARRPVTVSGPCSPSSPSVL